MLFFLCKFVFCILACLHESYVFVFANLVWLCESCMTVCVWTWIAWSSDPFGVNFSFLSGLFMFGHKLLYWVVPLVVNCSLRVVPQHQVESLKLENIPDFLSCLLWLLACMCVMKVESLKLRNISSLFFYVVFHTSCWNCTNHLFWARPLWTQGSFGVVT